MRHFGHRSKPAKRTGEADYASLFEASLIPLADHTDDVAVPNGDVKIGYLEITPTPVQQKFFAGVERRELLSCIVAVQAFDDLGEQGEAATFNGAACFERWLGAPNIDAGA